RLPEAYQLFIQRVPRDAERIVFLEQEVALFLEELEAKLDALEDLPGLLAHPSLIQSIAAV
ncbi:MAG: hypothetical protein EBT84_12495, partial [Sphingomonadaceae bacterium]|nr:hypothetical protein [Sphingomonadaceae bacterium]